MTYTRSMRTTSRTCQIQIDVNVNSRTSLSSSSSSQILHLYECNKRLQWIHLNTELTESSSLSHSRLSPSHPSFCPTQSKDERDHFPFSQSL